jgi:hypothetical protein
MKKSPTDIRKRFESALAGNPVSEPVFAVYDWFVQNRPQVDWAALFELGLGRINHATLVRHERPNVRVVETISQDNHGQTRRDVRWVTDIGELHECRLGEWQQEYLIKTPQDYRIMARALSNVTVSPAPEAFHQSESEVGCNGVTLGCTVLRRTAFQAIQIDFAGLEQVSIDIGLRRPELMELIEVMNDLTFREVAALARTPARLIKLWENLTIETMGPRLYREHLVPVYRKMLDILGRSGQRLCVHYDGKLRSIARDVQDLPFDIDSLTPPPEGDLSAAEARELWPEKFLWLHPPLEWHDLPEEPLLENIRQMIDDAGPRRFCLMISEDVPAEWARTVPSILKTLSSTDIITTGRTVRWGTNPRHRRRER